MTAVRRVGLWLAMASVAWFSSWPAAAEVSVIQNTDPVVFIRVTTPATAQDRVRGSGFLLNASGFVLTARHLVGDVDDTAEVILVHLLSKHSNGVPARLVGCSPNADVCILKVADADVRAARIEDFYPLSCRMLAPGEPIRAIGFPAGDENQVDQRSGEITGNLGTDVTYPSDAGVVPGMSGGPIFDAHRNVVGIVYGGGTNAPTLTFATPLFRARSLIIDAGVSCDPTAADTPVASETIADQPLMGPAELLEYQQSVAQLNIEDDLGFIFVDEGVDHTVTGFQVGQPELVVGSAGKDGGSRRTMFAPGVDVKVSGTFGDSEGLIRTIKIRAVGVGGIFVGEFVDWMEPPGNALPLAEAEPAVDDPVTILSMPEGGPAARSGNVVQVGSGEFTVSAALKDGSLGSPILDRYGKVVGIVIDYSTDTITAATAPVVGKLLD